MRENITTGDIPFRKAYLHWLIDAVEVDDRVIRIHGSKSTLEQAVIASSQTCKRVRDFARKWRARRDSNPYPPDSQSMSVGTDQAAVAEHVIEQRRAGVVVSTGPLNEPPALRS
jgi:hypothetical protein